MVERVTALLYCVGTCSLIEVSKQNAYEQRREQIWVRDGNITWVCKNEKACQRQRKITEAMQKSLTKLQLIFKNPEESGLLMPLDTILWRECNKIFKQGSNRIRFVIWKVQLFILFDFSRLFHQCFLHSVCPQGSTKEISLFTWTWIPLWDKCLYQSWRCKHSFTSVRLKQEGAWDPLTATCLSLKLLKRTLFLRSEIH